MFGVVKLFDGEGRLRDAAPYFGGPLTFGESDQPYTLTGVVFSGPDGVQRRLAIRWNIPGAELWGFRRSYDRITLSNLEVPPYMKR